MVKFQLIKVFKIQECYVYVEITEILDIQQMIQYNTY